MNIANPLLAAFLGVAFCLPANVHAQHNPNGQIIVTSLADPYLVLIRDPVVQAELRLNEQQRQSIRELTDELDGPIWTLRNQGGEKGTQLFKQLNSTAESRMEQILTAAQRKRLAQLRVSVFGMKALLRDDVAEMLDLSEQQRMQIRQVLEEAAEPKEESPQQAKNGKPPIKPVKSKPLANSPQTRIDAILSRQQLQKMRDVLGPPVDASRMGYVKFKAPELDAKDGWLNSQPWTMSQLRGKVFAVGQLLLGSGADLLAGADLLHHEPLELGTHRVDQPLRADWQVERGGDGRQNLRSENGRDRERRGGTVALFG